MTHPDYCPWPLDIFSMTLFQFPLSTLIGLIIQFTNSKFLMEQTLGLVQSFLGQTIDGLLNSCPISYSQIWVGLSGTKHSNPDLPSN